MKPKTCSECVCLDKTTKISFGDTNLLPCERKDGKALIEENLAKTQAVCLEEN